MDKQCVLDLLNILGIDDALMLIREPLPMDPREIRDWINTLI